MSNIKQKIADIYKKHTVAIWIFICEILYQFAVPNGFSLWKADEITYTYHAVDFSVGFVTKVLPGAIYNAIFKNPSYFTVTLVETTFFILFLFAVSLLLEKLVEKYKGQRFIYIVLFLFLTGHCTFSIYTVELGMLDVYWLYFSFITILLLQKKQLYPLIIPFAFLTVLVHYSSVFCYIPFVFLLVLYKSTVVEKKSEKALLVITAILFILTAAGTTIYFLINEQSNLKYSLDEFDNMLISRGTDYFKYYNYAFYRSTSDGASELVTNNAVANEKLSNLIDIVFHQIKVNFEMLNINESITAIPLTCPVIVFIYSVFIKMIKQKSKSVFGKLILVAIMLMLFVTLAGGWLFSTDTIRWYSHAFMCLFASFLFVLYHERNTKNLIPEIFKKIPNNLLYAYLFFYFTLTFIVYY